MTAEKATTAPGTRAGTRSRAEPEPSWVAALRAAWSGADPAPTDHRRRPAAALCVANPVALPRHPDGGLGGLLDLALAADPVRRTGGVWLRRVPSAGGRYPVDAHVDGRAYDPIAHAVADGAPTGDGSASLVLSLDPTRTTWRYGPRALPVLLLDLGHATAAVLAAAATQGRAGTARVVPGGGGPTVVCTVGPTGPSAADVPRTPAPAITPAHVSTTDRPRDPADPAGPDAAVADALAAMTVDAVALGPAPAHPSSVLTGRASADWATLTASGPPPDTDVLHTAAAARLGPDQHVAVLGRGHPVLPGLAARACGQPDVADVAALLLVTGDADPGPATPTQLLRAGVAVHDAWLAATATGLPARPVGCFVEGVLRGAGGRARVLHALAVGPAPDHRSRVSVPGG